MHKSLTEALQLAVTAVAVCHLGKVGVHAGIPAAEALDAVTRVEVADVIALAGGANEGAGAAAKASLGEVQSVKKLIFDRLTEVKGASKTNNSLPSAYRWYVRERVVQ